jgi:hypothetical protein
MRIATIRLGFTCLLSILLYNIASADDKVRQTEILPKAKLHQPIPFSQVRLLGELNARYMAATCNLLTRTDRYPLESFAASAAGRPGRCGGIGPAIRSDAGSPSLTSPKDTAGPPPLRVAKPWPT